MLVSVARRPQRPGPAADRRRAGSAAARSARAGRGAAAAWRADVLVREHRRAPARCPRCGVGSRKRAPWVALLAADLPFLTGPGRDRLLAARLAAAAATARCRPMRTAGRSGWQAAGGPARCGRRWPAMTAARWAACWPAGPGAAGGRRGDGRRGWTATTRADLRPRAAPGSGLTRTESDDAPSTTGPRPPAPSWARAATSTSGRSWTSPVMSRTRSSGRPRRSPRTCSGSPSAAG